MRALGSAFFGSGLLTLSTGLEPCSLSPKDAGCQARSVVSVETLPPLRQAQEKAGARKRSLLWSLLGQKDLEVEKEGQSCSPILLSALLFPVLWKLGGLELGGADELMPRWPQMVATNCLSMGHPA